MCRHYSGKRKVSQKIVLLVALVVHQALIKPKFMGPDVLQFQSVTSTWPYSH